MTKFIENRNKNAEKLNSPLRISYINPKFSQKFWILTNLQKTKSKNQRKPAIFDNFHDLRENFYLKS